MLTKWVVAKLQGDETACFCRKMSGRGVTGDHSASQSSITSVATPAEPCGEKKKTFFKVAADVWEKDVWEIQAKSGSSGSSFPSFPRENRSSENVWENPWKSQTSFFQTSAVF